MARFSKIETLSAIVSTGIVPVFYHQCPQTAKDVLKACYDGGIRAFEFTNRGEFAHEVFAELSKFAAAECSGMVLGAGSVVDGPTAALYIQLGANFIVGPMYNPDGKEVIARENEVSAKRKEDPSKAYFGCHTDITIPYRELQSVAVEKADGTTIPLIEDGRFVLPGTEELNEPFG